MRSGRVIFGALLGLMASQLGCDPNNDGRFTFDNQVNQTISWIFVEGATSYNIYWTSRPKPIGTDEVIVSTSDTQIADISWPFSYASFDDCDSVYYFKFYYVDASGEHEYISGADHEVDYAPPDC